ncbi:chemotaxis protein CheC [Orenia metallireducens]|jgi:chemotaxis protein CheC|uniref:Chemotaxis protein CheC n=1 Tax=Orenia metallireducens TaxID=1413210 RepID=A0A285FPR6_9FIRM|nr:chemotaxis protein CheC [Orenia metallireducens]PRX33652.1 chemotaxis protein CheC [Orenia metallireducens]SNY12834.1 chemotaxis protein CheC [Orenia metallireducens]
MNHIDDKLAKLGPIQLDALREVASIGAGNAATSLSEMLNDKIQMKVPKVSILPIDLVPEIMGGADNLIAAILVRIMGDINGGVLFTLGNNSANKLISLLIGEEVNIEDNIGELEESALKEVANILTGSNLNAFSQMLDIKIMPDVPALAHDMAGAILEVAFIELGQIGDYALVIETEILGNLEVNGQFFVIPNPESLDFMLKRLGVDVD